MSSNIKLDADLLRKYNELNEAHQLTILRYIDFLKYKQDLEENAAAEAARREKDRVINFPLKGAGPEQ